MSEWFSQVLSGLVFMLTNPILLFLAVLLIGGKWFILGRIIKRNQRNMVHTATAGWGTTAEKSSRTHDTGIGTEQIRVMRGPRNIRLAILSLLFWGGGVLVAWKLMLPEANAHPHNTTEIYKAWFTLVIAGLFCSLSPLIIWVGFHKIEVSDIDLVQRRPFLRSRHFPLSTLQGVTPLGTNASTGVKLHFTDGRSLRLPASFQGFGDVLNQIKHLHPDLEAYSFLGNIAQKRLRNRS